MSLRVERISELERKYVLEVLDTGFSTSKGANFMKRFECEFSKYYDNYNAISFVNGTATMHAALEGAGIGVGDEVIVPPLTMASTTLAVLQANASPIFCDIDPDTFQIEPDDLERKITEKTKAVITVALYGGSPKLDIIRHICNKYSLFMLEDNAECFGAVYKNKLIGCYGDAASFSFQSSKHLTSGEGGVLIVKDNDLADRVRRFQCLGYAGVGAKAPKIDKNKIQHPSYKRHLSLGFNYRMPELCAAVALAQTQRIEELTSLRVSVAKQYNEISEIFPGVMTPQKNYEGSENAYWTWVCKLRDDINWDEFRSFFINSGGDPFYGAWALTYDEPFITNLHFHNREVFLTENSKLNFKSPKCPNADKIQGRLCQFKTNYYSASEVRRQCSALEKTLQKFK